MGRVSFHEWAGVRWWARGRGRGRTYVIDNGDPDQMLADNPGRVEATRGRWRAVYMPCNPDRTEQFFNDRLDAMDWLVTKLRENNLLPAASVVVAVP